MFQQAGLIQDLLALFCIESARRQIAEEHDVQFDDMLGIVVNSPFVPTDRAKLVSQGLLSGWAGDFVVATHLLVPQVENSLRHALRVRGYRVSNLN